MSEPADPPPPPEEPPMEIHKPKPWHKWREFLKEYAIIVLGVLTALSLEQTVERVRQHHHYLEARDAMRNELANNIVNLGFRSAISTCVQKRLTEIGDILDKADNAQGFVPPKWIRRSLLATRAVCRGARYGPQRPVFARRTAPVQLRLQLFALD